TLNNLRHSVLFELVCKPYSFGHIRLYLVPKLPSKPSTNLGAPQDAMQDWLSFYRHETDFYGAPIRIRT
ncbi:hypothetical protein O4H61_19150, partial [Roseovarius aestuarii]|nr:hypothetical protein [Roseovarius aestuarii]